MKRILSLLLTLAVLLGLSSCSSTPRDQDGVTRIAYIVKAMSDEFWTDMRAGAEEYAAANDIELTFQAPDKETDVERQIQMVENALVSKADAIILSAADSKALIPVIVRANRAGVPVILVNDTIDPDALAAHGGYVATYVGIDQYAAAELAGVHAVAQHPSGGNVVLLEGIAGVSALQQRLDGFKDQIDVAGNFTIVASQTANNDRNQAFNVMQNVLQSNPEVDVVWAINAEMGQGAVQAIQQSGVTRPIAVYDFDASADDRATIRNGTMVGSVAQFPKLQAAGALKAAIDAIEGKELEDHVVTKAELVTKENVDTLDS
ncbi:MAG: sugar ABC transporter substrate-binding protein [Propionibacteriaceae bacterium]|nr:sugar ABC transporter substrate-binding protein [Propionibacteriaceae bacterium]